MKYITGVAQDRRKEGSIRSRKEKLGAGSKPGWARPGAQK